MISLISLIYKTSFVLISSLSSAVLSVSLSVVLDSYNPKDYNPRGSSVHGILQARILEWDAISFSRGPS